ncbi:hypothetical protein DPMN_086991 [Dreissena polymorpha]|uniref:B box-type domain-containing protein n=1 Tax=Dreissena polymorpha TaxID=45954 RepID=A0A9D4KSE8_DREPO|nr:hypothetical protein DPMN_086991 [Dreissena polymorpha]
MASISSLSLNKGSEPLPDFCCSACEEDGDYIKAQYYCCKCSKFFCVKCEAKHNELFKKHRALDRTNVSEWPKVIPFELCYEHNEKKIDVFCPDHFKLCCSTCVSENHRDCTGICPLSDVVKFSYKLKVSKLMSDYDAKITQLRQQRQTKKENLETLQKQHDEQYRRIQEFHDTLKGHLMYLETETVDNLRGVYEVYKQSFKRDKIQYDNAIEELKSLREVLGEITSLNDMQAFITQLHGLNKLSKIEQHMKLLENDPNVKLLYLPNNDLLNSVNKMSDLGSVRVKELKNVRIASDENMCDITGVCELKGLILLADANNKKVKVLNMKYQVISHLDLNSEPSDICNIDTGTAAVAMNQSDTHEVRFISMKEMKIETTKALPFNHFCQGLIYFQNHLYISSGTAIYQYTMHGQMVSKIHDSGMENRGELCFFA